MDYIFIDAQYYVQVQIEVSSSKLGHRMLQSYIIGRLRGLFSFFLFYSYFRLSLKHNSIYCS